MKIGQFDSSITEHRRKAAYIAIMVALALPIVVLPWVQTTWYAGESRIDVAFRDWYLNDRLLEYGQSGFRYLYVVGTSVLAVLAAWITLVALAEG